MAVIRNGEDVYSEATNNKDDPNKIPKKISNKLDILDQKIDGLYKDIYISRPDNMHNLDDILSKLDSNIDRLQNNELSVAGMSELLRRIENKNGNNTKNLINSVEDLFNDQSLINTLFVNEDIHKYIAGQNYQYDLICKYIPRLLDALEIKRDNVLCSDNFSKKFINPKSVKSNKAEMETFAANAKKLDRKYKLSSFFETTYMNTSKYGEDFIYIVPYDLAFKRLIKRANYRRNSARLGQIAFYGESAALESKGRKLTNLNVIECVHESYIGTDEYKNFLSTVKESFPIDLDSESKFKGCSVNLHFNDTNIILDKINEAVILQDKSDIERFKSCASGFANYLNEAKDSNKKNSIFDDVGKKNKLSAASYSDGLIIPGELVERDPDKIDDNFTGAVLERLPRENIVPVYIGSKCLGYYYFDFKEDPTACGFCGGHHSVPGISNSQNYAYEMTQDQQELAIRYIASKISANIDTHFINANKDLKEEIYAILQYNDKFDIGRSNDIGVSFIPAEDIIHCYFNIDPETHRGISDLQKSIIPAMLYILLYLTDIIGKITRSTDKRVYYVKQNVETNVARTMMNVVQQIKKGNFGMRQIESMNNILNIVGKYNDFIIPVGQSGDSPIQFEVMQGQQIDTPTDIMEKMEEAAINATGVPMEMVNATLQTDFASRFSMSNTRFLKSIFTRQTQTQEFFSSIYTKLYNYEFSENYSYIEVILPPPTYLTVTNTQQMIDNINQLTDKVVDLELSNEEDNIKAEFKRLYARSYLATYIDFDIVQRLLETAKVNVESNTPPAVEDGEASSNEESSSNDDYGF